MALIAICSKLSNGTCDNCSAYTRTTEMSHCISYPQGGQTRLTQHVQEALHRRQVRSRVVQLCLPQAFHVSGHRCTGNMWCLRPTGVPAVLLHPLYPHSMPLVAHASCTCKRSPAAATAAPALLQAACAQRQHASSQTKHYHAPAAARPPLGASQRPGAPPAAKLG